MLKNKFYLYGDDGVSTLPAHLHVGKFMLNKFKSFGTLNAFINASTDERMTFKEVAQLAVDVALSLAHIGIKNGDVVSICSENVISLPVVYGTLAAGATFCPIDVTCEKAALLHRLNLVKPKILFLSPPAYNKHKDTIKPLTYIEKLIIFGESIEDKIGFKDFLTQHASVEDFEVAPVNGSEDLALILFSSGTTGVSKGIKISHLSFMLHIQEKDIQVYEKTDVPNLGVMTLGLFDWYTSFGLTTTFYSHQKGSTVVFYNNADASKSFEIIKKYKINEIHTTPTTLAQLMKMKDSSHYDISSVKLVTAVGTICHETTLEAIRKRFSSAGLVVQYYGMTECAAICNPLYGRLGIRAGSVGGVRENFIVKIVDVETREPLGPNQRGEICTKSPALMKGYIGVATDYLDEEGFLKTGDIGYYDEDHYIYVVDRIKDLIKFNNYHVPPAEIESIMLQHPAVREVGVVGAKSEEFHELPTAFVALQPGARVTEQELLDFVDKQVSYKMRLAGGVRFLDVLPRCSYKLDRKKLRTMI